MRDQHGKIHPALAVMLAILGLCFLLLNSRGCFWRPDMHFDSGWLGQSWRFHGLGFFGFGTVIQLILAVWVGVDAQRRGSNGYLWGILVFFTSIVGLVVYLLWAGDVMERISAEVHQRGGRADADPRGPEIVAATAAGANCPACAGEVEEGFKVCPSCGAALRCSGCDKTIKRGWKVCPWCATRLIGEP